MFKFISSSIDKGCFSKLIALFFQSLGRMDIELSYGMAFAKYLYGEEYQKYDVYINNINSFLFNIKDISLMNDLKNEGNKLLRLRYSNNKD